MAAEGNRELCEDRMGDEDDKSRGRRAQGAATGLCEFGRAGNLAAMSGEISALRQHRISKVQSREKFLAPHNHTPAPSRHHNNTTWTA
jgi:hypothetical protein